MISAGLLLGLVFAISILAVLFAAWLANDLLKRDTGTAGMQAIAEHIREGSEAFVKRQYGTIAIISLVIAIALAGVYIGTGKGDLAFRTAVGFILGAVCSAIAGIVGMAIAVRANIRTASAARRSVSEALVTALRAGAISGILVVALTLIGVSSLYMMFGMDPQTTPFQIVGYAFGASLVALFAQLGGGIYTKAADVGADLVGKVEAGIPEDDPRNPAVIADLVGDNVGDCAGRGADLFESTAAENIGAMILGVGLFSVLGANGVLFPLVTGAFGLLASIAGILIVRGRENEDPIKALNRGYYITTVLAAILFGIAAWRLLGEHWRPFFYAGLVGLALAQLFVFITQYYTEHKYRPVKEIANAGKTGPATVIIQGLSVGMECTALPVLCISVALFVSYWLGAGTGLPNGGLYGTAVATMGMLSVAAYILAMDNFGPITDNAGGIVEMSNAPKDVRARTDRLDAVGNTTKALTKGYAIGSASLAAFLLFSAYMDEVSHHIGAAFDTVNLANLNVFIGALLGAMLVFLFSALAMRAVGKTAGYIIEEVRRQFKKKGIMEGNVKPNYARCVDITTRGALRAMILPGLLAVGFPIVVGLLLKYEAVAGFLMVGTIAGILMALLMNNAGGAWDNAKKYVESGAYGGKGSDVHKAVVVGDTVGDPFKDTAGPSLHVLIKLLATVTLVLAPLFI
ncbi:sodium-translocating pyrophosphatase [Candidatus Woesearchaeota archaeon]|nr:sodium-translocating pyrophosphatase [Candidatus Woesearchaeota archaeon]